MSESIINRAAVKRMALRRGADRAGWLPTRVAAKFIDDAEMHLMNRISAAVKKHRSVGKTITDF